MKKIPCLFHREFHGRGSFTITEEVTPGCEWVIAGEGVATRKWDGTACMVKDGVLYKRYDAKRDRKTGEYRVPPVGAIPCDDPDPITGHWPHWIPVGDEPESKWHRSVPGGWSHLHDGTYELIGPAINGNPEQCTEHMLVRHGTETLDVIAWGVPLERTFEAIRAYLDLSPIEGIVFHHPDGRMCKIRRHDFGFQWGTRT